MDPRNYLKWVSTAKSTEVKLPVASLVMQDCEECVKIPTDVDEWTGT